jgi:hypothetical protein
MQPSALATRRPARPAATAPRARPALTALLVASAGWWASPAAAVPVFELTAHNALVSLNDIRSGIGIAGTEIDAGVLTSNSLVPQTLLLQGAGFDEAAALFFTSVLTANWSIGQGFDMQQQADDVVFSASGALNLQAAATNCSGDLCSSTTTIGYFSENFQVFEFTLTEAAAYSAQGESAKDQIVNLDIWNAGSQTWQNYGGWNEFATYGGTSLIGPQTITPWTLNGSLAAGLYRLSNGPFAYTNPTYPTTSWNYQLTLASTQLAQPVPEPAALLLMGLGVAALLTRRRLLG